MAIPGGDKPAPGQTRKRRGRRART
jgi:hypothetical protein